MPSSKNPSVRTIGILGGGQLGRMIALEAKRMGYRCGVLDAAPDGPCAQVADFHVRAPVSDAKAAAELARRCDVVTLEWELISLGVLRAVERLRPLFPSSAVLAPIQDRLTQRLFLKKAGLPQTLFAAVSISKQLKAAAKRLGFPCVLKRRRAGYDGKGQLWLREPSDLAAAEALLEEPCVLEAAVPFVKEISTILARGRDGQCRHFPIAENVHRGGILHVTQAPARVDAEVQRRARAIGEAIAARLGHVGVIAVELFVLEGGALLVNEIAPRVHNSGHFTWGACATSQFEQHARAVCGLPLGDPSQFVPAVMVNLLGDLWARGEPRWERALARPGLKLHLYGKDKPAPGRKMGHVLLLGAAPADPVAAGDEILELLRS